MPGIAKHRRTEELHPANEADSEEKYLCPHCDAPVSHVRSFIRDTPSGDSTRVSPHFRFYDCEHGMQTERSASAGNASGGGSGESPLHRRRKVQAMNTLLDVFETDRYMTECYIGEKRCDAMVLLSDPHEQYGKGFVVEYQHKNEQKDIEAVERHYASHNFTTLWLWEDQFTFSGLVPDVDLFGGRVFKPWPQVVPDCEEWSGTANRHRLRAMIGAGTTTRVDATLKRSFTLPTEREYWYKRSWLKRFRFNMSNGEIAGEVPVDSYLKIIHNDLETHVPAVLPPEYIDTKIYTGLNWDSIEPVTDSAARYRLRAAVGSGTTTRVDATLRMSFILQSEQEYWQQQPWPARFGFSTYNQFRMDDMNCMASHYHHEVARTSKTSGSDAKLPPEYADTLHYRGLDWDTIPDSTPADEYLDELKSEYSEPSINISITQWLSEDFWRIAYFRGMARRSGLLERGHEKNPQRPPKPANPFNDIQCQNCGHYKPVSDASQVCEHCSTLYDLSWNVETGRVSSDSVREHILPTQATDD